MNNSQNLSNLLNQFGVPVNGTNSFHQNDVNQQILGVTVAPPSQSVGVINHERTSSHYEKEIRNHSNNSHNNSVHYYPPSHSKNVSTHHHQHSSSFNQPVPNSSFQNNLSHIVGASQNTGSKVNDLNTSYDQSRELYLREKEKIFQQQAAKLMQQQQQQQPQQPYLTSQTPIQSSNGINSTNTNQSVKQQQSSNLNGNTSMFNNTLMNSSSNNSNNNNFNDTK